MLVLISLLLHFWKVNNPNKAGLKKIQFQEELLFISIMKFKKKISSNFLLISNLLKVGKISSSKKMPRIPSLLTIKKVTLKMRNTLDTAIFTRRKTKPIKTENKNQRSQEMPTKIEERVEPNSDSTKVPDQEVFQEISPEAKIEEAP